MPKFAKRINFFEQKLIFGVCMEDKTSCHDLNMFKYYCWVTESQ